MKATEDLLSMLIPISLMCLGAPNMYDIVDLGCISDGQCYAMVINESGQVAGYGDAPNGMSTHGFVWDGSELIHILPLNYPNGGQVWSYGINDSGDVVGYSSNGGLSIHAYLWDGEQMVDLGIPEWSNVDYSRAQDINNNGWIVGMAGGVPYDLRGFIKHDDVWDEIPTFGGDESRAYSINDLHDVVGYARNEEGKIRAFGIPMGNINAMFDLGDLGGDAAYAYDVNNSRQVTGQSKTKDEYWKAYLWDLKTGMKELGTLGGNESYAWSLNDAGVVVGKSQVPEGGTHGFIWIDGEMFDINNYILPDVNVTFVNIRDINESGQLAAVGEYSDGTKHPFLLVPVDGQQPEDINGDGIVNVVDMLLIIGEWGQCMSCSEDINGDGLVNVVDLLAVISAWTP